MLSIISCTYHPGQFLRSIIISKKILITDKSYISNNMQKRMRLILLVSFVLILLALSYLRSSGYRAFAPSSQNNTGEFRELIREEIRNFFVNITNRPPNLFYEYLD